MVQQLAILTDDIDKDVEKMMQAGHALWVRDRVDAVTKIEGEYHPMIMRMAFNHDIFDGLEYELLEIELGPHHTDELAPGTIAHFGFDVQGQEEIDKLVAQYGATEVLQETWTTMHAVEDIQKDRSYHHLIYKCELLPYPMKLIEKISREQALEVEAQV